MKVYWWRDASLQCFMPASDAKTPTVACFEAREIALWRYQIVTAGIGEFEKLIGHLSADGMYPDIAGTGAAVTVSVKTCERIPATAAQLSP